MSLQYEVLEVVPVDACPACQLLLELYEQSDKSPRSYWVMTELMVMLHEGKDVCNFGEPKQFTIRIHDDRSS